MRTLVAAAEPPERPRGELPGGSSTTGNTADTVLAFIGATGVTVTPWQAVVIRAAYRTTTYRV